MGYPLSSCCDSYGRFCRDRMTGDQTGRELLALLENSGRNIDRTYLISGHYTTILEKKCFGVAWAAPLMQLRTIEERVQNVTACTITRVDENWLKDKKFLPVMRS